MAIEPPLHVYRFYLYDFYWSAPVRALLHCLGMPLYTEHDDLSPEMDPFEVRRSPWLGVIPLSRHSLFQHSSGVLMQLAL